MNPEPEPETPASSSLLLGEGDWEDPLGEDEDETDDTEEVAATTTDEGGDSMDRPETGNPDIAADALGVFATLFAQQEVPIDTDDTPET